MGMFKELSQFMTGVSFDDAAIELCDGKRICLKDSSPKLEKTENGVAVCAVMGDYKAKFAFIKKDENIFECSAIFKTCGKVENKIRKITSFKGTVCYSDKTNVFLNSSGFEDGVYEACAMDKHSKAQYFCSFFDGDDATTFSAVLPCKFFSEIKLTKNVKTFSVMLETVVPYSFEGDIVCQKWNIAIGMPTSDAIIHTADEYSGKCDFENPIGWSTWDYYFTAADENDVKENVDFIAADPVLSEKVKYIALDDGWQQREGDWQSGCRYPGGLKALVKYINDKGFEAGVWVAPTRLHNLCGNVMRRHSFLARNKYGDPLNDEDMYILDPTHPDGEQFLREIFMYLADCGFTFYKLDFISNMLKTERFYDKSAGPYDALKKLLDITRSCVPEGSHVMGCSLPYGFGHGFDSRRTGWDIHNTWKHVKACTGRYIPQFAANGKIYRNDIDYLVVRGKDTSTEEITNVLNPNEGYYKATTCDTFRWRETGDFDYAEAKTWCTMALMTGSSLFLGDRLSKLNEKGLELVKTTLENADFEAAVPVFENGKRYPEVWYKNGKEKIYVFNFSEQTVNYSVQAENSVIYRDVFTGKEYKSDDKKLCITLNPHDSVCLYKK
ncbi:MAG: alpha-galactosidase [Clostridia bacterium]|nr:alpha-galactosidase [Clostridia bacterium]